MLCQFFSYVVFYSLCHFVSNTVVCILCQILFFAVVCILSQFLSSAVACIQCSFFSSAVVWILCYFVTPAMMCILCHFLLSPLECNVTHFFHLLWFVLCASSYHVKWSVSWPFVLSWSLYCVPIFIVWSGLYLDLVFIMRSVPCAGLYLLSGLYAVLLHWVPYNVSQPSLFENCYLCINCTVISVQV